MLVGYVDNNSSLFDLYTWNCWISGMCQDQMTKHGAFRDRFYAKLSVNFAIHKII